MQQLSEIEADWRDGWLEFDNAELTQVVAELEKYYGGSITLALDTATLSKMPVTGRYHILDIQKSIRILAKSMRLDMSKTESGDITLSAQRVEVCNIGFLALDVIIWVNSLSQCTKD